MLSGYVGSKLLNIGKVTIPSVTSIYAACVINYITYLIKLLGIIKALNFSLSLL